MRQALNDYAALLQAMGRTTEQVRTTLAELGRPFGMGLGGAGGQAGNDPSPKLRAVIEELMRDPAKFQDIASRLQEEDPALFMELVQWIQSQQG